MNLILKQIKLANHAGFCYGVKRAVETTKKLKKEHPEKSICVLGELIHNSEVIKELEALGIKTINELPEVGKGICVIRSHGAPLETIQEIEKRGFEIVDLTCPDVKKVQNKAIELVKDERFVIILGRPEHPEVIAIQSNAQHFAKNLDDVFVAKNLEALKEIEDKLKKCKKIGVVVQTTQRIEFLKEILDYLVSINKDIRIMNTICASTSTRQNEARELAKNSDLMVVVGSKKSANTTHLAEILQPLTKTIHIEGDLELNHFEDLIKSAANIGVTAGASTPDYIINKVIEKIENISKGEN